MFSILFAVIAGAVAGFFGAVVTDVKFPLLYDKLTVFVAKRLK